MMTQRRFQLVARIDQSIGRIELMARFYPYPASLSGGGQRKVDGQSNPGPTPALGHFDVGGVPGQATVPGARQDKHASTRCSRESRYGIDKLGVGIQDAVQMGTRYGSRRSGLGRTQQ